ncbi:hypothetical protein AB0M02_40440 [Actinoplanes sp. NPDC051861]|uniref:hypothetical protein n=1 Tax=Actinoplanes sp. NPDC051861 TaxID=3155170 RepID=UPI003419E509
MDVPDGPEDLDAKIARLAAALSERARLEPRRAAVVAAITKLTGELEVLRRREEAEQRDVEKLEGFSVGRVLTTLRGAHGRSLDRERTEAEAARERVAEAMTRLDTLESQLADVKARLAATDTAPATYALAIAEKERLLQESGHLSGTRLAALAAEKATIGAQLERLTRAATAAGRAAEALRQANELLESAGNWSAADTFLGGGAISSHAKHERLEEAAGHVSGAERQLEVLRKELGDSRVVAPVAAGLGVDGTTRLIDVWFDNIFTDVSVGNQIGTAQERIGRTAKRVRDVRTALAARIAGIRARLREIESEREKIISISDGC